MFIRASLLVVMKVRLWKREMAVDGGVKIAVGYTGSTLDQTPA